MQRRNANGLVVNEAGEIKTNPVLRWAGQKQIFSKTSCGQEKILTPLKC